MFNGLVWAITSSYGLLYPHSSPYITDTIITLFLITFLSLSVGFYVKGSQNRTLFCADLIGRIS